MNNFTLIIPTHNRHNYIKRSIDYFKDLEAVVIYCDSSIIKYEGTLFYNTKYLHIPGKSFAEKMNIVLNEIRTDFVAMCADDDFILHDSLYKGFNFLTHNSNFKTVVGKYLGFNENFNGFFYPIYQKIPDDINLGAKKNGEVFFKNHYQLLWSMYDKKILVKSFKIIKEAKFYNDNFIEIVIGACACFEGGIKFLNVLWGIREISIENHWGTRHLPVNSKKIADVNGDFDKFKKLVDFDTFSGYSDIVINSYLYGQSKNNNSLRFRLISIIPSFVKKAIKKIHFFKKWSNNTHTDPISNNAIQLITQLLNNDNKTTT